MQHLVVVLAVVVVVVVVFLVIVIVAAGVAARRLNKLPRGWLPSLRNLRTSPEPGGSSGMIWWGVWGGGWRHETGILSICLDPPPL